MKKWFLVYCFLVIAPNTILAQHKTVKTTEKQLNTSNDSISTKLTVLASKAFNFYENGNYSQSFQANLELLKQAQAANNLYYIHKGYSNLGYDYLIQKDTTNAKDSFEKSRAFAAKSDNKNALANTYMDLGNLYVMDKSQMAKAYTYYDKSVSIFKNFEDVTGLVAAYFNILIAAMKENNLDKADIYIKKLDTLLERSKDYDGANCKIALNNITADFYTKKKNYKLSNTLFQDVITKGELAQLSSELETAYFKYSESLHAQGKYKEAFNARKKYEIYYKKNEADRLSKESKILSSQFKISEYKKDLKKAELESQLQKVKADNRSILNFILMSVSITLLLMFIYLFFVIKKRKQLYKALKTKSKAYLKAKQESDKLAKVKSNFFSTVSHELRTPLYGVIGLSSILLDDDSLKEEHKKDLKSLKFSADYLLALINDVLLINKIDSNKVDNDNRPFNLKELINTIITSFEFMCIQNNNKINISIDNNIPQSIRGNSISLSQILMNLVSNACKFTENGTIDLQITCKPPVNNTIALTFYIKDTGYGISKEKQKTIFEEFKQGDTVSVNYQGTGLGLPIVKKLIQHAKSEIHVESEVGKGSTFYFTLLFDLITIQNNTSIVKDTPQLYDAKTLEGKHILIVDDNRINLTVTEKILSKNNVNCTKAINGAIAVDLVKKHTFDLVLMDINMPIKNGLEATKEIREFNTELPIIALTAVEIEEMRQKIYQSGMNDIIIKPYDIVTFKQSITKNLISPKIKVSVN